MVSLATNADIVEIKHIMLPPSPREFKDIYVVFELMETDLHQASLRGTAERFSAAESDSRPGIGLTPVRGGLCQIRMLVAIMDCSCQTMRRLYAYCIRWSPSFVMSGFRRDPAARLSQVIKANDDLTPEHHQFFLYQMLRGLKYIHTGAHCTHVPAPNMIARIDVSKSLVDCVTSVRPGQRDGCRPLRF